MDNCVNKPITSRILVSKAYIAGIRNDIRRYIARFKCINSSVLQTPAFGTRSWFMIALPTYQSHMKVLLARCTENPPITSKFPPQKIRNEEIISMSWRHRMLQLRQSCFEDHTYFGTAILCVLSWQREQLTQLQSHGFSTVFVNLPGQSSKRGMVHSNGAWFIRTNFI